MGFCRPSSLRRAHAALRPRRGTNFGVGDAASAVCASDQRTEICCSSFASKIRLPIAAKGLAKAALAAAVMLHLRSCYVSKAAILTVPVLLVPVENRSPA